MFLEAHLSRDFGEALGETDHPAGQRRLGKRRNGLERLRHITEWTRTFPIRALVARQRANIPRLGHLSASLWTRSVSLDFRMNRRDFFERAALSWDDEQSEETASALKQIVEAARIQTSEKIVDIGSGTGILLPLLREAVGEKQKIIALDLAFNMLKLAVTRFDQLYHYVQADVHALPLKDSFFDKVICFSSFPHFANKGQALVEISKCLRAGGKVIIAHSRGREAINTMHREIGGVVEDDILPEEKEMRELMEKTGFVDVSILGGKNIYLALGAKHSAQDWG